MRIKRLLALGGLGIALLGCSTGTQALAPTVPPAATAVPTAVPSPTVVPSATPLPRRLVFAASPGSAPALEALLQAEAKQAGLDYVRFDGAPQPADLGETARVVVLLAQPGNLAELQAAAPAAQFAVVSAGGLEPSDRLTVIRANPEEQAFVAGLTAVLISDSWRAAGLIAGDQPLLQEAFRNGGGYFCGPCAPGWPLNVAYPLVSTLADGASADGPAWAAALNELFDPGKAEVFYLSPQASREEVYAALAGKTQLDVPVKVVGSGPAPAQLKGQWAAGVVIDPLAALQKALPEMLAGRSAGALTAPPQLIEVDADVLSLGRQALIKQALADLAAGLLSPAGVP